MKKGNYGPGNTDFQKYKVSRPNFTFWNRIDYAAKGCGQTALSFLTGEFPKLKDNAPINDRAMRGFLRKHGIKSFEINRSNLSNSKKDAAPALKIQDHHVLLVSLVMKKGESSWVVIYNNMMVHNFDITPMNYLYSINYPWRSGYVLFKEEWK